MLEEMLDIGNVKRAFGHVTANKCADVFDGMHPDELHDCLKINWQRLRSDILKGIYRPRAVEIPKSGVGSRKLGIPTVIDWFIQESIYQWFSSKYGALSQQTVMASDPTVMPIMHCKRLRM